MHQGWRVKAYGKRRSNGAGKGKITECGEQDEENVWKDPSTAYMI